MASAPPPTPAPDPDLPLVEQALTGDYSAFEQLVNRYEKRIYGLCLRLLRNSADAQDATQATLLALIEKLDTFAHRSLFSTWLLRIATNEALVLLRKRKSARAKAQSLDAAEASDREPLPHPDFIARWKQDPEQLAGDQETRQLINQALDELDEKYRTVFLLRDVQGLSTDATAKALRISQANVKVRLLRARLMLRERLTRVLGDPATALHHEHSE